MEKQKQNSQILTPLVTKLPWSQFMDNFIRVSIPYSWVKDDTKDDTKDYTKELAKQQLLDNKIDTK